MLHFRMGGLLAVSADAALTEQIRRVGGFCGSDEFHCAPSLEKVKSALKTMRHLQLITLDLRVGMGLASAVRDMLQRSDDDRIHWVATAVLVTADRAQEARAAASLGFDTVLVGPFSDTLLEKRFQQIVLDAGADPQDETQMQALFALLQRGEFLRAEGIIRRGMRRHPDALAYVTLQCELHMRFKRHHEARLLAMASLHARPGYTPLRHIVARCYVLEGSISQAFIVLEQAVRDAEGDSFALRFDTFEAVVKCLNNEGVRRAAGGDVEDALGLYTHALASTAGFPEHHHYLLWHNLGMAYKRLGNEDKAKGALETAARLSPRGFSDARTALAALNDERKERMQRKHDPARKSTPPASLTALFDSFGREQAQTMPSPSIAHEGSVHAATSEALGALRSFGSALAPPEVETPLVEQSTLSTTTPLGDDAALANLESLPADLFDLLDEDAPETAPEDAQADSLEGTAAALAAQSAALSAMTAQTASAKAEAQQAKATTAAAQPLDDAARREQRRKDRLKFIMFEKELEEI
jgi:tetratricopeptide (TPR) repeat protein